MKPFMVQWIALPVFLINFSAAPFAYATDSSVVVEQIGDYNTSNVVLEGEGNILDVQQTGISNTSGIGILGEANIGTTIQQGQDQLLDILITGNNNHFSISQAGLGIIAEQQNLILLKQEGNDNSATHTQIGSGNSQNLGQLGNGNTADLIQDGNNNTLILQQNGDLNSATLSQYGDTEAPIEIHQTGGAVIEITHTAGGS